MTAPAFVNAAVVHTDTTANASPIATSSYSVSASGHTLLAVIDHERANSTTPLNITGITRNGQSFVRANKGDLGSATSVDVADIWILENADVGDYPLSVSHNGVTGSDIQIGVVEYDGGTLGDVSTPAYVPGSTGAVATFDITIPADARLVYLQVVTTAGGTWTGPSHGTSRLTAAVATGTAGGAMAVADYVPSSPPESATAIGYAFTPASSSWTNGSNHVIGIVLEASGPIALTIADAEQAQTADGLSISVDGGTLTIGDGAQAQSADGVTLDGGYTVPTVSRPAGGGDVDVAATIVTNGTFAWPTIEVFGDPESNDNISGTKYEGLFFDLDLKETGKSPVIKIDFSNWRVSTPPANNKGYWRYASDIGDMYAWLPFDSGSVAGSVLTAWNAAAFTESAIQVANIPPVPYDELEGWLTTWDANAHIFRPAACAALGVSSSAPNKYAYYDFPDLVSPDGIQVGSAYAFAFGITNAAATGPKKRLFHTWTHAGEWGGLRAMLRFAERLMSVSDADHDSLRDDFEHVFLIVNTAGMVGGMARGAAEAGDVGEDTNRVWGSNAIDRSDVTDPIPSVEASVALLVSEWGVDGDDLIDCLGQVAWHSHTASATKFGTYSTGFSAAESAFLANVEALYGAALHDYGASSTGSSTAFARSGTVGGFALTFEWSYAFADFLNEIGDSVDTIGPALVETLGEGWFGSDLGIGDSAQAQTADTLSITLDAANLTIGDAVQGQGADALTVSLGDADLVIADATQAQSADGVVITLDAANLVIGDAEQLQGADALTVSLGDAALVIADAEQGQAADGVVITLDAANLAIGDATQGQSADVLTVSLGDASLVIADAEQGQVADAVTLTLGAANLVIGDAEQGQTADNVILLPWVTLVIGDAEQGQAADAVVITIGGPDVPPFMTLTRGGRSLTMTRSGRLAA